METQNSSHNSNTSSENTSLFSGSPYTTLEIALIILVAESLSLITVVGNILVMLSIKVCGLFQQNTVTYFHQYIANKASWPHTLLKLAKTSRCKEKNI